MPPDDEKQNDDAKDARKANRFAHLIEDRGGNRRNGRRASPLYVWMWDNYDALVEARSFRPDWAAYLSEAAADGVTKTTTGRDLTPHHAKVVWMRVRRAKRTIAERTKEAPSKVETSRPAPPPSRMPANWRPAIGAGSSDAKKDSSVAGETGTLSPVPSTTSDGDAPLSRGRRRVEEMKRDLRRAQREREPGFYQE